jgi:metal-dependent hydrolase (beta-lactamase superfamily II)
MNNLHSVHGPFPANCIDVYVADVPDDLLSKLLHVINVELTALKVGALSHLHDEHGITMLGVRLESELSIPDGDAKREFEQAVWDICEQEIAELNRIYGTSASFVEVVCLHDPV